MKIKYSRDALKFLARLDEKTVARIRAGISGLTATPPLGDVKPLQGYKDGRQRLRVGTFRVIFKYEDGGAVEVLFIIDIGNRGDIYK